MAINFFSEKIDFKPKQQLKLKSWIKSVTAEEGKRVGTLNYVFCDDEYILDVNRQYLQHDYYTDIITFDDTEGNTISGDMVISLDTVRSNAEKLNTPLNNELCRVVIHGILHLCGYKDKAPDDEKLMRSKEDYYLAKFEYSIIEK